MSSGNFIQIAELWEKEEEIGQSFPTAQYTTEMIRDTPHPWVQVRSVIDEFHSVWPLMHE